MARDTDLEVMLISHSNVLYWWPAWVIGYIVAFLTWLDGRAVSINGAEQIYIPHSNNPGLLFIATILLLIVFTNAKLRGIYSVMTILTLAFIGVVFALLGWWDAILEFIPTLKARANVGFYVVFSTLLLIAWLSAFFVFDRLNFWRMRPGQLIEQRLVGASSHSVDTNGLVFEKLEQDFFRHIVLGLGAGDLRLRTRDPRLGIIDIPNVVFVNSKVRGIERLIAVKPEVIEPTAAVQAVPAQTAAVEGAAAPAASAKPVVTVPAEQRPLNGSNLPTG